MAEFTSAEKVNIGYENEYSTDAMTGGPDKRRQLYYQLIQSRCKVHYNLYNGKCKTWDEQTVLFYNKI